MSSRDGRRDLSTPCRCKWRPPARWVTGLTERVSDGCCGTRGASLGSRASFFGLFCRGL